MWEPTGMSPSAHREYRSNVSERCTAHSLIAANSSAIIRVAYLLSSDIMLGLDRKIHQRCPNNPWSCFAQWNSPSYCSKEEG